MYVWIALLLLRLVLVLGEAGELFGVAEHLAGGVIELLQLLAAGDDVLDVLLHRVLHLLHLPEEAGHASGALVRRLGLLLRLAPRKMSISAMVVTNNLCLHCCCVD